MSNIINYIKTNCSDRQSALKCIMYYYYNFKYRPELQFIAESTVFDSFADRSIHQNQQILSDLYIMIDDGKIKESLEYFKHYICLH